MSDDNLTTAQLASRLSVTRRTVDNLMAKGMPRHGQGKKLYFQWPEAFTWYVDYKIALSKGSESAIRRDESYNSAELRKLQADADLRELKLQRELGKLIDIGTVGSALSQVAGNVRGRLRVIPAKMAQRLVGRKRADIKALLEKEIDDALSELSQTAGSITIQAESGESEEATASAVASAIAVDA